MPMVTCEDYGKRISSRAKACPDCGCPNEVNTYNVPANMEFSNRVLMIPTFDEVEIPHPLGEFDRFEEPFHYKYGWIDCGDMIFKAKYHVCSHYEKPSRWKYLFSENKDPTTYTSFELESSCSGLIVSFRTMNTTERSDYSSSLVTKSTTLPMILLPEEQPNIHNYELNFFRAIAQYIKRNHLIYTAGYYGDIRLKDTHLMIDDDIKESINQIESFSKIIIDSFETRDLTKKMIVYSTTLKR